MQYVFSAYENHNNLPGCRLINGIYKVTIFLSILSKSIVYIWLPPAGSRYIHEACMHIPIADVLYYTL